MQKLTLIAGLFFLSAAAFAQAQEDTRDPKVTEIWDPKPKKITPGVLAGEAPSDAVILFDGKGLGNWTNDAGTALTWEVKDGAVTVTKNGGNIKTKQEFGDFQLHIEWRTPTVFSGEGQERSNSGIFLQSRYELQVLDSYESITYSNGQAGSIYKQSMPLVNVTRKPGEWQVYDVVYTAPRFSDRGTLISPARITALHNGVLIQNNTTIWGSTEYRGLPSYKPHGKAPLLLQDHGNAISYRNIWIREL